MSTISDKVRVGSRIQVGKDRATVKFIGSVEGSKGEWLGVEWDDLHRGKHDGSHQGTKYFDCRGSTSGSFIRYHPQKVLLGTAFLDALKCKYLEQDDITTIKEDTYDKSKDRGELYFGGNKQIVVETYGFEKIQRFQSDLSKLKVVGLAEQLIQFAGEPQQIADAKLNIEDLDLSRNLISDWETVSNIASQLPKLTILRLNHLRFTTPPRPELALQHIKTLSLSHTLLSWNEIRDLLVSLPNLEDLQLGGNELSELSEINLPNLKCINIEDNKFHDWSQVAKLGTLPNLEVLFLNNNHISKIEATDGMFPKLNYIRLDHNTIDNWDSLNALNQLPALTKIRCKGNSIFKDMDRELEDAHIVGRIKNLTTVNGNTLTSRERTDLERYYLKFCVRDGTTKEEIMKIHPRYSELCSKHGEPDLGIQVKESSTALKDRLINITLTTRESIPSASDIVALKYQSELPPLTKSLPKKFLKTMTVRNMKNMIQRLMKIPATDQHLFLLQTIAGDSERDLIVMDVEDDLRDLKFYGISDGDEILIVSN
ncbi:Tubulin-specific chaperone E [Choanephora cucurbitarum]|uniref:Tubulin-specific chaperone E n=1 Tax=Choanephora cucurbitarum TaxID=101091 RepID=A0A1C7NPQ9_9FUNG|nr:Tubulin-specific chaperone E [Choanephora cucurbitarum]